MKTKTPFYELAEKYAEGANKFTGVCKNLDEFGLHYDDFFTDIFQPTMEEEEEYEHCHVFWMAGYSTTPEHDDQFRILAILFADLLWQDEMKGK